MCDPNPAPAGGSASADQAEPPSPSTPVDDQTFDGAKRAWDFVSDLVEPRTIALVVLALIVGLVGLIGGWQQIEDAEDRLPVVTVGSTTHVRPFDVAVLRAYSATSLGDIAYPTDGVRFLIVVVRARLVDSDEAVAQPVGQALSTVFGKAFTIDDPDVEEDPSSAPTVSTSPDVYRLVDGERGGTLQPGLDYELVLVWRQTTSQPMPSRLTVTLHEQTYRKSSLLDAWGWTDAAEVATLELPATALPRGA